MTAFDRFGKFKTPIYNGQDFLKKHIFGNYPIEYVDDTNNFDVLKKYRDVEYVWLVDQSIKVFESFPWHFKPINEEPKIHAFPYVFKKGRHVKSWDKVKLVPTKQGTYETNHHIHICGEYDVYKGNDRFDIFYIGNDKTVFDNLENRNLNIQFVDSFETAQLCSYTDMFWLIYDDTEIRKTFKFSYEPDEWSFDFVHVFGNGDVDRLDGVALFPKDYTPTEKELAHRFYAKKKEIRILASNPKKYDQFIINNFYDYEQALKKSTTEMFWGIPGDVKIIDESIFNFTISHHDTDKKQNHVWLNDNKFDGVVLFSKHSPVTKKEVDYRSILKRIEHDIKISTNKSFDQFTINSYEDYCNALKNSTTSMFWSIPSDIVVVDNFDFDYFTKQKEFDRSTTHVFLNNEHYDGVALFNILNDITEKEIEHRFYTNKKEINVIASNPIQYNIFKIDTYEDYLEALKNSKTEMFWGIPSDVTINKDFNFSMYFSHSNKFDREINHVFLNDTHRDGIVLYSKKCIVSEKEIEHRFYIKKKEWDIVASYPKIYDKFEIKNYNDFIEAKQTSKTEMFWITYPDLILEKNFNWNFYINHHNQYERKINHVWKNGEFYDGVALVSKHSTISKKEIDHRFFSVKKEYDVLASNPKPFDVVFISKDEPNADENYNLLKLKCPNAKRVHGVDGIHRAHRAAAELVSTEMFWVVDGDAQILDDFDFDYQISYYDLDGRSTVYVWRSLNPVNGLVYGYGGVKLLPTILTMNMDLNSTDMTTSITNKFRSINRMSNITAFNTDDFSSWRSAFRECAKLSSKIIARQRDDETEFRLNAWCSRGEDKPFGKAAIHGAQQGRLFGETNKNNIDEMKKINDFEWLNSQFKQLYQLT